MKRSGKNNNSRRGANWDKDGAGRPSFRSKTWGERSDKDPHRDRRNWKRNEGITA